MKFISLGYSLVLTIMIGLSCAKEPSWHFTYKTGECKSFQGTLEVQNLKSNKLYALALYGKPGMPGNNLLLNKYNNGNGQGFFEFKTIQTNENRMIKEELNVELPPGPYNVMFVLKEVSESIIIEIHSSVIFHIQNEE